MLRNRVCSITTCVFHSETKIPTEDKLITKLKNINLPGVLKTGLPEILSQVQHIAGNLLKLNLLKALILLV